MLKHLVFILSVTIPSFVIASRLDPIIVSSKTNQSQSELTVSSEIISEDQIELKPSTEVVDILRSQSDINISQTGGPGSAYSIFIRGAESRHTVVLIDGVRVNDPTSLDGSFNMASLSSLDIEKVEIIKGPQSLLHGSDAIGGVINIITNKGSSPGGKISIEGGVQKEIASTTTVYGKNGVFYLNGFYNESNIISSVKNGDEKDLGLNRGLTLNYAHVFDEVELQWQAKLLNSYKQTDGFKVDSDINYSKAQNQIYFQKLNYKSFSHKISYIKSDRFERFGATTSSDYSGSRVAQELNYNLEHSNIKTIIGLNHEYSTYEQTGLDEVKTNLYEGFISSTLKYQKYFTTFGARQTNHEEFGDFTSFNAGVGLNLENRKQIKINYATGFKAPSAYQLFVDEPFVKGNDELDPEKSRSVSITYLKQGTSGYEVALYDTHIDDFINYDSTTTTYFNSNSLRTYGIDLGFYQKYKKFLFEQSLALNKSHDSSKKNALKRPKAKANLNVFGKIDDKQGIGLEWSWVSSQFDSGDRELVAFDLVNLTYKYKFNDFDLKASIRNLFDRDYEEAKDYETIGLNGSLKIVMNY